LTDPSTGVTNPLLLQTKQFLSFLKFTPALPPSLQIRTYQAYRCIGTLTPIIPNKDLPGIQMHRNAPPPMTPYKDLPGIQMHRNAPLSSRQVPSFLQGSEKHSFMLTSHRGPVNPTIQSQRKLPGVFTQDPPCSHGDMEPGTDHTILHVHSKRIIFILDKIFENYYEIPPLIRYAVFLTRSTTSYKSHR
jgi:hypothetical protein